VLLKWTARISAGILALVMLVLFAGREFPGIDEGTFLRENNMTEALFVAWIGYLIGWKKELAGGILVLFGLLVFTFLDFAYSGSFPRGVFLSVMSLPGALYITSGLRRVQLF